MDEIIRAFPSQSIRVESGPIRFGDDWPGIFLRGDDAGAMSFYLLSAIERLEKNETLDPLTMMYLKGLAKTLAECRLPSAGQEMRDAPMPPRDAWLRVWAIGGG